MVGETQIPAEEKVLFSEETGKPLSKVSPAREDMVEDHSQNLANEDRTSSFKKQAESRGFLKFLPVVIISGIATVFLVLFIVQMGKTSQLQKELEESRAKIEALEAKIQDNEENEESQQSNDLKQILDEVWDSLNEKVQIPRFLGE